MRRQSHKCVQAAEQVVRYISDCEMHACRPVPETNPVRPRRKGGLHRRPVQECPAHLFEVKERSDEHRIPAFNFASHVDVRVRH